MRYRKPKFENFVYYTGLTLIVLGVSLLVLIIVGFLIYCAWNNNGDIQLQWRMFRFFSKMALMIALSGLAMLWWAYPNNHVRSYFGLMRSFGQIRLWNDTEENRVTLTRRPEREKDEKADDAS